MSVFDWLRIKECTFQLVNRFAWCGFFKFFITKDKYVRTNKFGTIPILLLSKSLKQEAVAPKLHLTL